MLTLQRASAGSGKTYTLTKTYIRLLISITDEGAAAPRLREMPELADSAAHILGVTFTNKATNEMKTRIVAKLADLAYSDPDTPDDKVDYLVDFMTEFGATRGKIAEICREALHQLLYEYSDFNISTIDTFFQNILRTFAYEADLPDAYRVVIDSEYIMRAATIEMIEDMKYRRAPKEEAEWVRSLIREQVRKGAKGWNAYDKKNDDGSSPNSSGSVFTQLSRMARDLEKEEYKEVRKALERFYAADRTPMQVYKDIQDSIDARSAELFGHLVKAARDAKEAYAAVSPDLRYIPNGKNTLRLLDRILGPDAAPDGEYRLSLRSDSYFGGLPSRKADKAPILACEPDVAPAWDALRAAVAAHMEWRGSDDFRYWQILRRGFPRFALLRGLRDRIDRYLQDNDAMRLSDTNEMIRRIIADDEVPFIYERMGNYLHHFLIDEFQDTSKMQWHNFRPLLRESESHNFANLIIGDAKQSIYRFRNAEPKLITTIVPKDFPALTPKGFDADDNANHRSRHNVVRFNNFLFRAISLDLADGMPALYANTVQTPRASLGAPGYVEIDFYRKPDGRHADPEEDEDSDTGKLTGKVLERIAALITDLLRRGFRQKEIAVLTNTRAAGQDVIRYLMDYNKAHASELREPLRFVSADSLLLSQSQAVETVIECFRLIQATIDGKFDSRAGSKKRTDAPDAAPARPVFPLRVNWTEVRNNYRYFVARNRAAGLGLKESLEAFFTEGIDPGFMEDIMGNMQALTLPSLVEMLTEIFVDVKVRELEAPFLAAFQDALLAYCESNPTDIGSMLRWWNTSGRNICISSPEDTDAVCVMTVHKSKGLEFECVILPDIDLNFVRRAEWMWLEVPQTLGYAPLLPGKLPVCLTDKQGEDTVWAPVFEDERRLHEMDLLNKAYVAFTRAVSELYVFMPAAVSDDGTPSLGKNRRFPDYVHRALADAGNILKGEGLKDHPAYTEEEKKRYNDMVLAEADLLIRPDDLRVTDDGWRISYGEPLADVEGELRKSRGKRRRDVETLSIEDYYVNSRRKMLECQPEWVNVRRDPADDDRLDPRSEGSLKHEILELVEVEDDLHKAMERVRGRGHLTRKRIREYEPQLREALVSVRDRGWFAGKYRVLAERPMLMRGESMKRPDRVMISPEGDAIVVDYKFGTDGNISEHRRQVGEYMGWMREMKQFRTIRGYIWYVNGRRVVEVEEEVPFVPAAELRRRQRAAELQEEMARAADAPHKAEN